MGTFDFADIENWFSPAGTQLNQFKTAGGATLSNSALSPLVSAMTAYQNANPSFDAALASGMPNDPALQAALTSAWQRS